MTNILLYLLLGLPAGAISGLIGIPNGESHLLGRGQKCCSVSILSPLARDFGEFSRAARVEGLVQ